MHLLFLFPKQAKDNITSVRLLRKEILQNVSVIRLWGKTMPLCRMACLLWVVEGRLIETTSA